MAHPRCAFGASPSRGRHPWPGEAGSTVALDWRHGDRLLVLSELFTELK
ncbi:hypothetical protein J2W49_004764 [Hydrogenophaga palleronii]|uniref:Uncharacterized protein n=1 Tax=Hydrogenophaga palleronii TaxID=65655 RepID=A0ABU1WTZ7_9BURK|nr:hypothetical protein [Hydrogenophaga palleronii]